MIIDLHTVKTLAREIGFDLCGVAPCRPMPREAERFRRWLEAGHHSSLAYLERNAEKRFDPARLVEGARTAVVCAVGYKNRFSGSYPDAWPAKVASYACTTDYHTTLRAMLHRLLAALVERYPGLAGRAFVDTAPLSEKRLAVEAGLGWIGRHSLLVTPCLGSYVLLGELLLAADCDTYDHPLEGVGCGACRRCVDRCPTCAIVADEVVDTRRCISCHTIEREPATPLDLHGWIFGCDACQAACPYNALAPECRNADFAPVFSPLEMTPAAWRALTHEEFRARFGATPLSRSGLDRIRAALPAEE